MDKSTIVTIVVAILGSGAFSAIVSGVINARAAARKTDGAMEQAVSFLLASDIRAECQEHINAGEIDAEDLSRLEKAWAIYHDGLGGNGFLDTYMHDIRNLPKSKVFK